MRFCYAESMTDPSFYAPLARAAEQAGFDSMMVPDSICYPAAPAAGTRSTPTAAASSSRTSRSWSRSPSSPPWARSPIA